MPTRTEVAERRVAHQRMRDEAHRRLADLKRASSPTEGTTTVARRKSSPPKDETKAQKWSRLANHRLRIAIKGIDGLAKLATTAAYERTDDQIAKMTTALHAAVARVEKAYASGSDGTEIPVL